jgi:predicted kinase
VELVILVGLPGSGKSTFYRERFAATHVHVSKDLLKGAGRPARRQEALIADALASGRSVVVDNTNPSVKDRAALIALARAHGARVVAYFFRSTPGECLARNRRREGAARIPNAAIFIINKRLQPPTLGEGLDALYEVRLVDGEGFVVTGGPAG